MAIHRRHLLAQTCAAALAALWSSGSNAQTVSYTYDELGRVRTATYSNGATITYTYDAAGNRTQVVQVAGTAAPSGTFSASPTSISTGGSSTLSWTSTNATSASIDNGVGSVTPVSGGSVSVSPTTTTTYTLTLTGAGGQTALQATVTVSGGFNQTIQITGTAPVNLRTLANTAGYNGAQNATIIFQVGSGVTITGAAGAPTGGVAIDTGTWPSTSYTISLALQVSGNVYGGGGIGGQGSDTTLYPSGAGGDAMNCQENIAITVNTGGQVKGGGGGGGGGGGWETLSGGEWQLYKQGGGGGGGFPNGPGGSGLNNGSAGTTAGGGAGGAASTGGTRNSGAGGTGGAAASAGVGGATSSGTETSSFAKVTPGVGGGAGYAIRKNGKTVTVTNNGTITGTVS